MRPRRLTSRRRAVLLRRADRIGAEALAILDELAPPREGDPGRRDWPVRDAADLADAVQAARWQSRHLRRIIENAR